MDYIRHHASRFGVESICCVLSEHGREIAPSTFYTYQARGFGPTSAELEDAYTANELFDLWVKNQRVYGRRKLYKAALRAGMVIGRDRVARLMKILGIEGVRRGQRPWTITTLRDEKACRFADHIQRRWGLPDRPDQWWVADFTYVWTLEGFCYVSFITDVYSRHILGWRVLETKDTVLVSSALEQALFTRRRHDSAFSSKGIVHHSDAGSQSTSWAFTKDLLDADITGSIGTVGDAYDNALMESTIGLYKSELIDFKRPSWDDWRQVERDTAEWVAWYNHERLHSGCGDIPPIEYETLYNHTQGTIPMAA